MANLDIVRNRLARQRLTGTPAASAADVVRVLGAVQAQEYADAKWALALRARDINDRDLEREFNDGSILRTHVLRPTWHFVAPENIRWLLALTGPRLMALATRRHRELELTGAVLRKSEQVLAKALDGKQLTRREVTEILNRAGISNHLPNRHGHILMHAELNSVICSGPRRDKQFTYALLEERVPPAPVIERDEALSRLALCYFATRGPATMQDFSWWSGLTMSDVKRALQTIGREVEQDTIDGRSYFLVRLDDTLPKSSSSAHLLPIYDEYFIAYKDRSAIGRRVSAARAGTQEAIAVAAFVVVTGQIVGRWKRKQLANDVAIEIERLVATTSSEQRLIGGAVQAFRQFLGLGNQRRHP